MQKLFRSLIAIGGLAGLVACGDDVSITPPPDPDLAISGAPVTAVQVGAIVQLSANLPATWATSNAAVATVDGTGKVTAVGAGTASITATSTADVTKSASVTITVTAPSVRNVVVSPNAVTMNPGGTQGFVANVDADPGVARTVTWTSSNNAVVTITAAGVATAVAPGAATITATSTANTSVSGAASVTVRTLVQPRVSIQKVTVAGNLNNPVNLNAVAGQIDVTIDVDPGDFIAQRVELLVDGVVVGAQNFTAAESRELTNGHAFADLAEAVTSTVISFVTNQFNAQTGEVGIVGPDGQFKAGVNFNGPHQLSARLITTGGTTGSTATPSANLAVTFANANTWLANMTETGTTATATGTAGAAAGLAFRRGGMDFSVRPVIFNQGQSLVANGSFIRFGSFTCDASGNGPRTAVLTGTASPFTASMPQTVPSGGNILNTVANYEFDTTNPACVAGFPFGEFPTLTGVDNFGNSIMVNALPAVTPAVRRDNRAPSRGGAVTTSTNCNVFGDVPGSGIFQCETGVPVLNFHTITGQALASAAGSGPNGRTGGWMNDAVGTTATVNLTAGGTSGADNLICNNTTGAGALASGNCAGSTLNGATSGEAPHDAGVGGVTFTFKAAATTSLTTASAASSISSLTPLGESTTDVSFCGVAQAVDGLGNTTAANPTGTNSSTCANLLDDAAAANTPAGTNIIRFGADFTEPTAGWDVSSFPANARINTATLGGNFVMIVNDPGAPATASGIPAGGARWLLTRKRADGTTNRTAAGASTSSSSPTATGAPACGGGLCSTAINTEATTAAAGAFWSARALVFDAAGNMSPEITRDIVGDGTPAVVVGPSVPASISGSFSASGAASDNLDLRDYWFSASYCGPQTPAPTACAGALAYVAPNNIQIQMPIAINTFPPVPGTLQNSNVALTTTVSAPLILQATDGAGAPQAYAANAGTALGAATVNVRDQTMTAVTNPPVGYVSSTSNIGFPSIVAPSSGISTTNFTSFITSTTNTSLCAVAAASAGCVVGTPAGSNFASTVLTATATGTTAVFNNPFGRIDFYCANGAQQVLLGSSSSPVLNDNGAIRTFAFSLTVSAAQLFSSCGGVAGGAPGAALPVTIFAFGLNSAGTVALVAQPLGTITVNP